MTMALAKEGAIVAVVELESWLSLSELGLTQRGSIKYFVMINCIHTTDCGTHQHSANEVFYIKFC
jgi:hypothetical protein